MTYGLDCAACPCTRQLSTFATTQASAFQQSTLIPRPDSWLTLARESGSLQGRDRQISESFGWVRIRARSSTRETPSVQLLAVCGSACSRGHVMSKKYSTTETCIYCGRKAGSEEHVFPNWLRKQFAGHGTLEYQGNMHSPRDLTEITDLRVTVRSVCGRCNQTWMGGLQQDTKPLIQSLLLNTSVILDVHECKLLTSWAVMTAMCGETRNPPKRLAVHRTRADCLLFVPGSSYSLSDLRMDMQMGRITWTVCCRQDFRDERGRRWRPWIRHDNRIRYSDRPGTQSGTRRPQRSKDFYAN